MTTCPTCGFGQNPAQSGYCLQCRTPLPGLGTGQLPPQSVVNGRYTILRRVGQGGMGAVYQVVDQRFPGKTWALKELADAALGSPAERAQAVAAFRQEATLLATLRHPNLPQVSDYFTDGGRHYLVMDFVEGETLERMLSRGAPLPEPQVLDYAIQLCGVLGYLHSRAQPLIFRDLKPGNVMITPQGQVKLIDFGIARLFKPGQQSDTIIIGTHGYAPPEQYGRGQTDARSDIYSLGVTLHHLLTGHDPLLTPFQLPPARRVNPAVSPHVEAAILRATAHDPALRFPSAVELAQALLAPAPPGGTAPIPPVTTVRSLPQQPVGARRSRTLLVASCLVGMLVVGGLGGWAWWRERTPSPAPGPSATVVALPSSALPTSEPTALVEPTRQVATTAVEPTLPEPSVPPAVSPIPTWAEDQASIEATIWRYVDLKARASGEWQTDGLEQVLQGEALQTQLESVRWLRDNNSRWEYELHSMILEPFERQDADHVRVTAVKVETARYYHQGSATPSTRQSYYRDTYTIWYNMERIGGKWYITDIDL